MMEVSIMLWVTRSHVHVDRVACPWLILRFVDNQAEFLFVPAKEVKTTAEETGAIPFDAPDVELGHHEGRCSFESIILKYELKDPALVRLAKIVHAADVAADIDIDPIARGLEAIAVGYGIRFPDDEENLERQFDVYAVAAGASKAEILEAVAVATVMGGTAVSAETWRVVKVLEELGKW
jgi:hypothetical protein